MNFVQSGPSAGGAVVFKCTITATNDMRYVSLDTPTTWDRLQERMRRKFGPAFEDGCTFMYKMVGTLFPLASQRDLDAAIKV